MFFGVASFRVHYLCCLIFKLIGFYLSIEALKIANLAVLTEKFVNPFDFDYAASGLLDIS